MLVRNLIVALGILTAGILSTTVAHAQEFDLTLSDNSALFRYIQHSNNSYGHSEIDAGFLYTDSNDFLMMLGVLAEGEAGAGSPGLNAGIGVKAFSANNNAYDLFAIAIGGELRYSPPSMSRLGIRGQLYHAPGIVTFMDADDFTYGAISVEYEVLQQATVYLGYRSVKSDLQRPGKSTIDDDSHIGLRLLF